MGPMEPMAIADAAGLRLPSLTRILRTIKDEGLWIRRTDPQDRRGPIASITHQRRAVILRHAAKSRLLLSRPGQAEPASGPAGLSAPSRPKGSA